jgi:predicted O-methyltransferase YrrM
MDHFWKSVHGYCTFGETFYPWLAQQVPLKSPHIVEVGCAYGQSTACLAVELINRGCEEPRIDVVDIGDLSAAKANLAPVAHVIGAWHRMTSVEAAQLYAPGSLSAVFIDANHSKPCVLEDIAAWRKKVRPGGILAGHDHSTAPDLLGVIDAVVESFERYTVVRGEKFGESQAYFPAWYVRIGENGAEL